jgi:hypothetical protein
VWVVAAALAELSSVSPVRVLCRGAQHILEVRQGHLRGDHHRLGLLQRQLGSVGVLTVRVRVVNERVFKLLFLLAFNLSDKDRCHVEVLQWNLI